MRSPKVILENLQKHSKEENYKYERLYRNLYNEDFYLQALQNIYANKGAMTPGIDGLTLDGFGKERVERLIASLKDHSYQPKAVRRQYIKKKSGKLRPLGISSSDDKLVGEIVKMILESIYDTTFSNYSHGFRLKRSCHTALMQLQHNFTGIKWFVEGDIKSYFDTIDHHNLINILRRRIKDEAFIELIWKFLHAGYLEKWEYHATFSGIAQGSGISPILSNIYLNEFDHYMENYKKVFDNGESREKSAEYMKAKIQHQTYADKVKREWDKYSEEEKKTALYRKAELKREFQKYPMGNPMDENYKRIQYVRYADDFIIGVIGSREDAEKIKYDIKEYFKKELKLELSEEKTLITSGKDKARFLGYDVTVCNDNTLATVKGKGTSRIYTNKIKLYLPKEKWVGKLLDYGVLKIVSRPGEKEVWKPLQRDEYIFLRPGEMVLKYNAQIQGIYNYYRLASNVSVLNKFRYVMEYSLYKTLAAKYRITMTKAKLKFTKNKEFKAPYNTKSGTRYATLYNSGFRRVKYALGSYVDIVPEYGHLNKPKELFYGYKANICEMCDAYVQSVKVYQVRSLADLDSKTEWGAIMQKKQRKTLVACEECYNKIHK